MWRKKERRWGWGRGGTRLIRSGRTWRDKLRAVLLFESDKWRQKTSLWGAYRSRMCPGTEGGALPRDVVRGQISAYARNASKMSLTPVLKCGFEGSGRESVLGVGGCVFTAAICCVGSGAGASGGFISWCTIIKKKGSGGGNLPLRCARVSVLFTNGTARKHLLCADNTQWINAGDDCWSHQRTFSSHKDNVCNPVCYKLTAENKIQDREIKCWREQESHCTV